MITRKPIKGIFFNTDIFFKTEKKNIIIKKVDKQVPKVDETRQELSSSKTDRKKIIARK